MASIKPQKVEVVKLINNKLETSALTEKDAKTLGIKPAKPGELKSLGFPDKLAMEIPYFNAVGKLTGFKRWRYLEDTRDDFTKMTMAKPLRYVQSSNTLPEIYLPPLNEATWKEIQNNPNETIAITEGELKAACCSKHVLPCIGLGGVYSFKSKKNSLAILPALKEFNWTERKVFIIYDSDASHNQMVIMARNELAKALLELGAMPFVTMLPETEDEKKQGLDDFIYEYGVDKFFPILEEAEAYKESIVLHELNQEVAYIINPGIIIVLKTGQKISALDFKSHAFSTRHYTEISMRPDGELKMVKKQAAPKWLTWPFRHELNKIVYEPGNSSITEDGNFNTWQGWGCEPKKGNVKPWTDLLDHLFKDMPESRSWFERWCAYPLQHPGAKMYTAAVIWGINTGTGKSLIGYTLGEIYGKNFIEIGDGQLTDERNEWAVNKQFVMGDDVTGHEQRKLADRLKKMITQKEMRIDQKYVPSYSIRDVINYLFTSNHPDAFFLEDDDRRNFVHEIVGGALPSEFYRNYMRWRDHENGASHLFHHLLTLDLKGMKAEDRAPDTIARRTMMEDGLSDVGVWVRGLRDDPDNILKLGDAHLKGDLWAVKELLKIYDPDGRGRVTANGLGREMKRAGFRQVYKGMPLRTVNGQHRLFAVRNKEKWLMHTTAATDILNHYDTTRGSITKPKKY